MKQKHKEANTAGPRPRAGSLEPLSRAHAVVASAARGRLTAARHEGGRHVRGLVAVDRDERAQVMILEQLCAELESPPPAARLVGACESEATYKLRGRYFKSSK